MLALLVACMALKLVDVRMEPQLGAMILSGRVGQYYCKPWIRVRTHVQR